MAQEQTIRIDRLQNTGRIGGVNKQISNTSQTDSLKHRDQFADSITISFRYLDSTRNYKLDSSINDFTRRFPIPATNIYLGNTGNASKSILFSPSFTPGWDPGFHAFDIYKWKLENVRFFNTTRPYSELNYLLGGQVEQIIEVLHTQNIRPSWNVLFQYRLINSPGYFKNQGSNHNNYILGSRYQSPNKRYNNYFLYLRNKLQSAENGGIKNNYNYLDDPVYKDRFNIPTNIGGDPAFGRNFFSSVITTGNIYSESNILLRQQFDIGKKDSVVTDSLVIPLFYPRLRFEHTFRFSKSTYKFFDGVADSVYYKTNYDTALRRPLDTLVVTDNWREVFNDFSIYQFPDAKNLHQFIKLGVSLQNLTGEFSKGNHNFYNIIGHAEYRNKTRNEKWDIEANGKLFFAGLNAGDYQAYASLQRFAGSKKGYIQLGFENVNRTPSFIFDTRSSFYLLHNAENFKKENSSHFFASVFQPGINLKLSGHYFFMTNYTYLTAYYKLKQESNLFNILQAGLEKIIKIGRRWKWNMDIYFQQKIGNAPVNLPLFFTRNRIGYEGNLGFKNLDIAFGTEIKYNTPYKADGYSPVLGRFFYQDSIRISNPLPDISAYIHFRIRSFKSFFRVENLNTLRYNQGLGFTNNNLVATGYAMPGLQIRLGIYWGFVN